MTRAVIVDTDGAARHYPPDRMKGISAVSKLARDWYPIDAAAEGGCDSMPSRLARAALS